MKQFRFLFLFVVVAVMATACSNDDDPAYYEMRGADGRSIYVSSVVTQYNNESDFTDMLCKLNLSTGEDVRSVTSRASEVVMVSDTVSGYDSEPYLLNDIWRQVSLGFWCERFGLVAGETYLLNFKRVTKYIPCAYNQTIIKNSYLSTDRTMGYYNGSVGYALGTVNDSGKYNAYTLVAVVGYDIDGNVLNVHYPCELDSLLWKYFVIN